MKSAVAQIIQFTTEPNPDGVPIGVFRMTLFHTPDMEVQPAEAIDAIDFDPAESNAQFTLEAPGAYYVECTRLTQSGLAIGPVATSSTVYVGDGTQTFQAPLVIALSIQL